MKNPQVDAYIAKAAPFARPILRKLRQLFHKAVPAIEERIKWGHPSFEHRGMLGGMAAFKQHAAVMLWRQKQLADPHGAFQGQGPFALGRLTDVSQLPPDGVLLDLIRQSARLNEAGAPRAVARKKAARPAAVKVPAPLLAALRRNKKALSRFEAFPPSHKREYVEWIAEAKKEETRQRRIATAVEWIAEGKPRNWKYA